MPLNKFIFLKKDIKLIGWSGNLTNIVYSHSYLGFFIIIIKRSFLSLFRKKKDVIYYRYLNTDRNFFYEALILIFDILIFFQALLGLIELRWIIHNIDKETIDRFPLFTLIKKKILFKISTKKYVLDEILVKSANTIYNCRDIIPISFGKPIIEIETNKSIINEIKLFRKKKLLVGISSCWVNKSKGVQDLIIKTLNAKKNVMIFYLGKPFDFNHPRLIKFKTKLNFNINDFDFCLKSLNDLSIPATLYDCAFYKKPIIYDDCSIFGQLVNEFELGCNINVIREYNFEPISDKKIDNFFEKRNWTLAREKLFK